ncbi:MAG: DNA polymerase I, partial [Clostridium sp.]|nr:DNA polymerase I [Clostridium sp.]
MAKIVLLDGHSILHRTFYGIPPLNNTAGFPTNAIVGFLNILYKLMDEEEPEYVAVAFDVHAPTFRHELYKEYKGTRKPMPPELAQQIPKMKELLAAFGIVLLEKAGFEADDILGTIAKRAEAQGLEVSLISGDRDLLQIASKNIQIRIPKTKFGKTTMENYYEQDVLTAYHVTPEQFIELKALMGDPSDNIPGVPKIGEKTATTLMEEYGSIDAIYQNLDQITKKSIRESLEQNRALADLSKTLATIDTHAPIECDFHEFGTPDFWSPQAIQILDELEIRKRRNTKTNKARNEASSSESELGTKQESRRETGLESNQPKYHVEAIDADMFQKKVSNVIIETDPDKMTGILQKHAKESPIALQILTQNRQFYGFCLVTHEGQAYFCPITQETQALGQLCLPGFGGASYANEPQDVEVRNNAQEKILKIIETSFKKTTILTYNIKSQYAYLPKKCESHSFDLILGTYLLKPLQNEYTAEGIAKDYFDLDLRHYADLFGKKTLNDLLADPGTCQSYAEYVASTLLAAIYAYPILLNHLEGTGMMALMKDVEMPLTRILYEMEKEGIAVLRKELFAYGETLVARIKELEQQIYAQAGVTFTILSPKQLGEVLFERLSLPSGKKTKTGYSTAAEVLEKLVDVHPIIRDVLEYRGLTKLKSTYADGLATYIESDERIHTNFQQTITATGRISSTEPNLQNIPMRTELGRKIRKVFVPKEGCVFVDADYSQIELRVLAHMSGDKQLIEAYKSSADIHRITAA